MKKQMAYDYIDIAAGEARARYVSVGVGQESTYMLKAQQAREYKANSYTGDVPVFVQVEAYASNMTSQQAADFIIATQDQWLILASYIEGIRRGAKVAIDSLTNLDEVDTKCQETLDILANI